MAGEEEQLELTILMPCLNEARTVGICVKKAMGFIERAGIRGEVVVADNGSTDGSQDVARQNGARIVAVPVRGYGAALLHGIRAAKGRYVIMGDSDDSYDFVNLDGFVAQLRTGYDLVMGNRFRGGIKPGAMPPLHRYFGNPLLSAIGRLFFRPPCGDFYCGLRGFRREAVLSLDMQAVGMEFAHEMVVKASIAKLKITEVPTVLSPDGRGRPPHLRSWRDGWRTLRFLLLFSPRWLFLYPGVVLLVIGLVGMAALMPAPLAAGSVVLDVHTLFYTSVFVVVGFQSILFWVFSKVYAIREGFLPEDPGFRRVMHLVPLEVGLVAGAMLLIGGVAGSLYALGAWGGKGFGALSATHAMRMVIPAGTAIILALQAIYGAFFVSVLELRSSKSMQS